MKERTKRKWFAKSRLQEKRVAKSRLQIRPRHLGEEVDLRKNRALLFTSRCHPVTGCQFDKLQ